MIRLINYKEFGDDNAPSIRDYFEKEPYPNKVVILEYLKNGKVSLAAS